MKLVLVLAAGLASLELRGCAIETTDRLVRPGPPPFPHQIFGASKSGACHQGLHDNDAFPFPVSKIHRGVYIACANLIKLDNFERLRTAGRDGDMGSEEAALFVRGLVLSTGPRCLVVLC
jgi:hypothetical protein